ncbi:MULTISPECIES: hypothetical protein [unclassified Streptomyces]|uniref:hypothetical protein n=1 Tax=unclassified Streptomyces TaxID=2593676 RepID=UPI00114D2D50|nr:MULTISPECIES: hypothetical protein [unclassified Streptomyces]MYQ82277.1 hypothetical protein [Streptomyces sp. SID4936]
MRIDRAGVLPPVFGEQLFVQCLDLLVVALDAPGFRPSGQGVAPGDRVPATLPRFGGGPVD